MTLAAAAAFSAAAQQPALQPRLTFEVASMKPAHVDDSRADFLGMSLRDLVILAYSVRPNQIAGPDWLASQRFDIAAKLPSGATKDDATPMLRALLEERFGLVTHRASLRNSSPTWGDRAAGK